jgi:hypothetical protein
MPSPGCRSATIGLTAEASLWSESKSEIGDKIEKEIGVMDMMFRHDESSILTLSPISPR